MQNLQECKVKIKWLHMASKMIYIYTFCYQKLSLVLFENGPFKLGLDMTKTCFEHMVKCHSNTPMGGLFITRMNQREWKGYYLNAYTIYIRKWYYFSLVCTFKKAIKNHEVKVNVQKETLRFQFYLFLTIDVLVSFITHFHWLLSYDSSPRWPLCPFLLGCAFGVLLYKHKALEVLMVHWVCCTY
jgi:hypothetical protein